MGPQSWSGGFGVKQGPQSWAGGFEEKWGLRTGWVFFFLEKNGASELVWRFWRKWVLRAGLEVLEKNILSQLGFKPQTVQQHIQLQYKAPGEIIYLLHAASLGRTGMRTCSSILSLPSILDLQ